jgi:hypothetical protein|tara:strand:- start:499 stop:711 length:213 start_codon:yes stop_codon:yes gene_type:complete
MDNVKKFVTAVRNLRADTEMAFNGEVTTEAEFNKVNWKTGEDSNGSMISTTTCPHSEITWTKVKAEMDKL